VIRATTLVLLLALLGPVGLVHTAIAESRSVSHSDWLIVQDRVTLRFLLPVAETRGLVARGLPPLSVEQVAAYILDRVSVSAAGSVCPAIDQGYDIGRIDPLSVGTGLYGFEIIFKCPRGGDLVLRNAVLFDRFPRHVNFARIEANGRTLDQLFTAGRERLEVPETGFAAPVGAGEYSRLGASHVLHNLDRLFFLMGAALLARGRREYLSAATAMCLGYAVSVTACASGFVVAHPEWVDAAVGLLIALLGAQIVAREGRRPRRVAAVVGAALLLIGVYALIARGAQAAMLPFGFGIFASCILLMNPEHRRFGLAALTASFGFLDGLVLPGDYARLQLWRELVASKLIAFDAGAVLTNGLLIAIVSLIFGLLQRTRLPVPQTFAKDLTATLLAGTGVFWMLSRLYG
jgi:HupE / UreJ protein